MKKYGLIGKILALTGALLLLCSCVVTQPKEYDGDGGYTPEISLTVSTASYELKIPADWSYTVYPGEELSFTKNNEAVGGVETTAYFADQPLSGILPVHSSELKTEELTGFSLEGYKLKLLLSQPAVTGDSSASEQLRYVFVSGNSAYHIYFDSGKVSDAVANTVAKSFILNNGGKVIKTDTGTYTGQVDNNSIEIRISGVQDESIAHRVFKISDEVRPTFEGMALEEGDMIKFQYYDVENQQPVLVSIERMVTNDESAEEPEIVTLTGKIKYNEVESGFYELEGYRLTGDFDFERYQNQTVTVTGEVDDSPSIYMVKTLKVSKIEVESGK